MTMEKGKNNPILVECNAIIYVAHFTLEFRGVGRMDNRCIEVENLYIK